MSRLKGQILIITLFALGMSMTILFFLATPVRNQVLRVKKTDFSFTATAKAIAGLEISFYEAQKSVDLSGIFQESVNFSDQVVDPIYCGDPGGDAVCHRYSVEKDRAGDWFRSFRFYYLCGTGYACDPNEWESVFLITQGIKEKVRRSLFFTF